MTDDKSLPTTGELEAICERFRNEWQAGRSPDLRAFVALAPEWLSPSLFRELVAIDLEYQQKRGVARTFDDYRREFPEFCETGRFASPTPGNPFPPIRSVDGPTISPTISPGQSIGSYRVVEFLGMGAQAEAYRVRHATLDRSAVVKIWRHDRPRHTHTADDLTHEGRMLVQLPRHDGLPQVYDCDVQDGRPYLVFEDVAGCTLKDWLKHEYPPLSDRLRVMRQIAETVAWLHERDVVHQDLKPANILICPAAEGQSRAGVQVKLIDFGLANWHSLWNLPTDSHLAGTPGYMAPEIANCFLRTRVQPVAEETTVGRLAQAEHINIKLADVYSLGCVLYYLLTEHSPYELRSGEPRDDFLTRCARCDYGAHRLSQIRQGRRFIRLCRRAMAADPGRRPSAAKFVQSLNRLERLPVIGASLAACLLLLVAGWAFWFTHQAPQAPTPTVEHVYRNRIDPDRPFPLDAERLPVYVSDDKLTLEWEIHAGHAAACYVVTPSGELRQVQEWPRTDSAVKRHADVSQSVAAGPDEGTVCVFVCTARGAEVPSRTVEEAWQASVPDAWPALPKLLLRVSNSGAAPDLSGESRGADEDESFFAVRDRLDDFCAQLQRRKVAIAGIAYPQAKWPE